MLFYSNSLPYGRLANKHFLIDLALQSFQFTFLLGVSEEAYDYYVTSVTTTQECKVGRLSLME